jgi:hypothetical protein
MSETQKKAALGVVIVVALGLAIWQGMIFISGPRVQYTKSISSGFSANHTGKGALMATEGSAMGGAKGGGNLAGPTGSGK